MMLRCPVSGQRAASGGALVMLAKKGKGGSGMTNIGRVVATRERMAKFKEPQKVRVTWLRFTFWFVPRLFQIIYS